MAGGHPRAARHLAGARAAESVGDDDSHTRVPSEGPQERGRDRTVVFIECRRRRSVPLLELRHRAVKARVPRVVLVWMAGLARTGRHVVVTGNLDRLGVAVGLAGVVEASAPGRRSRGEQPQAERAPARPPRARAHGRYHQGQGHQRQKQGGQQGFGVQVEHGGGSPSTRW